MSTSLSTFHVGHIHIANVFHQMIQHIHMPIERLYGTYSTVDQQTYALLQLLYSIAIAYESREMQNNASIFCVSYR